MSYHEKNIFFFAYLAKRVRILQQVSGKNDVVEFLRSHLFLVFLYKAISQNATVNRNL